MNQPLNQILQVIEKISELRSWRKSLKGTVGFVPTMGALHSGHAELLNQMKKNCDHRVLSIFVNPTQFGPNEDLSKYPRTFQKDLEIAKNCGVEVVFFPSAEEMYPASYSTFVEENTLSQPLCGRFRPGHFRGVTTIVLKLLNSVQPHKAFFGLKDAQQFFVLKKMLEDLNLDIEMIGVPTVREKDGLALSSRNVYLSPEERQKAPEIFKTLTLASEKIKKQLSLDPILTEARQQLEAHGFIVQYLEALSLPYLQPLNTTSNPLPAHDKTLLAIAVFLGKTRLIDNLIF